MDTYRLKEGFTHHHFVGEKLGHVRLEAGDVVELTDAQAKAFADRFERASAVPTEITSGNRVGTKTGAASASGTTQAPPASTGAENSESDLDISDMNVDEVAQLVADANAEELDAVEAAEDAGAKRKGVFQAIEARRAELE